MHEIRIITWTKNRGNFFPLVMRNSHPSSCNGPWFPQFAQYSCPAGDPELMELLKEEGRGAADNCGADIQMVHMTQIQQRTTLTWWSLSNIEEHRLSIVCHQQSQSICNKSVRKYRFLAFGFSSSSLTSSFASCSFSSLTCTCSISISSSSSEFWPSSCGWKYQTISEL